MRFHKKRQPEIMVFSLQREKCWCCWAAAASNGNMTAPSGHLVGDVCGFRAVGSGLRPAGSHRLGSAHSHLQDAEVRFHYLSVTWLQGESLKCFHPRLLSSQPQDLHSGPCSQHWAVLWRGWIWGGESVRNTTINNNSPTHWWHVCRSQASEYEGIKIFSSNSSIYFANSDLYMNTLMEKVNMQSRSVKRSDVVSRCFRIYIVLMNSAVAHDVLKI